MPTTRTAATAAHPAPARGDEPTPPLPIGVRILALFASDPPRLSIYPADAETLLPGVTRAAMYRECRALADAGWLEQSAASRETAYRLGPTARAMLARAVDCCALEVDLLTRVCDDAGRVLRQIQDSLRRVAAPRNAALDDDAIGAELTSHLHDGAHV